MGSARLSVGPQVALLGSFRQSAFPLAEEL